MSLQGRPLSIIPIRVSVYFTGTIIPGIIIGTTPITPATTVDTTDIGSGAP